MTKRHFLSASLGLIAAILSTSAGATVPDLSSTGSGSFGASSVMNDDQNSGGSGQGDLNIFIPVSPLAGTHQSDQVSTDQRGGNADSNLSGYEKNALLNGFVSVPKLSNFFPIIGLMVAVGSTHVLRRRRQANAAA